MINKAAGKSYNHLPVLSRCPEKYIYMLFLKLIRHTLKICYTFTRYPDNSITDPIS